MSAIDYFSIKKVKGAKTLSLKEDWTALNLTEIHHSLTGENFDGVTNLVLNAKELDEFDTTAALYLQELAETHNLKLKLKSFSEKQKEIWELVAQNRGELAQPSPKETGIDNFIIYLGKRIIVYREIIAYMVSIFGEFVYNLIQIGAGKQTLRMRSVVYHINETGIRALPVIFLMAFAIAIVMSYQGATQLRNFGATIYTIDLVTISVLREMGVLLTAIMVAGRTGSAFAAQIGTMKLNEEIAALKTMGVSPFNALILPRIAAIILALPLLTFLANIVALLGLYVYVHLSLDISFGQFMGRLNQVITPAHFWVGMIKAPVFAIIIGTIGCMHGMQVRSSAEDVGKHTTKAVVQSIFMIILADALFSILYTNLGI